MLSKGPYCGARGRELSGFYVAVARSGPLVADGGAIEPVDFIELCDGFGAVNNTMSRKHKILALAISSKNPSESPAKPSIVTQNSLIHTDDVPANQKNPKVTDLNELWSRPIDYKTFPTIFENENEYCNSSKAVKNLDLSSFVYEVHGNVLPYSTRHSLICYESIPPSDDERCDTTDLFDSDDSVKDKDYNPKSIDPSDSDSSHNCNETRSVTVNADIHDCTYKKSFTTSHDTGDGVQKLQSEVSEMNKRNGFLSTGHNVIENEDIIETENVEIQSTDSQLEEFNLVETVMNQKYNIETPLPLPVTEKGLTKSGLPRKRRRFDEPVSERKRKKKESADEKLSLKPPCYEKNCRKKCTTKITEDMRKQIHEKYINLCWESRGLFIKGHVESRNVRTRTTKNSEKKKNRDVSYQYYLYTSNREKVEVCRPFFLTTLGYNAQNARHIHTALNKDIDDQQDKRGSYVRTNLIDKDIIKDHIGSFNPMISHYRREHAPQRMYLPSDLNRTIMHQSFLKKYPDMTVSLETYRQVVNDMNISFAHLGNEECEECALFESHQECNKENCEICTKISKYEVHKLRYTESRKEYQKDKDYASTTDECVYFSVDLQKVIMLPRMDQFKSAIFCPRIVAFNESFVPLGSSGQTLPYAVLWNETVSGRRQEDIISTYRSFFIHHRDVKHIFLWADNCSAQNKNWALMCFLVNIVNSDLVATESITLKFFEPGHTFMSADSFHHQVETALKKKGKVYDFDDFVDAVKMSNSKKNTVKVMTKEDFFCYEDHSSQHKLKNMSPRVYLHNIMTVKAERGQLNIKYKESHMDEHWKELDFLQVKVKKTKFFPNPPARTSPRGIESDRKLKIIKTLVPLMPETRRHFWINLPETAQASKLD